jgi:hypothetical protein
MNYNFTDLRGASFLSGDDASLSAFISVSQFNDLQLINVNPTEAAFNLSACNSHGICSVPLPAIFNWQPAAATSVNIGGGTSVSLIGGNATTASVASVLGLAFAGLFIKYGAPKIIDICCFENTVVDPLELAILKNMNKRLKLSTPA